jgi:hypothetical protein
MNKEWSDFLQSRSEQSEDAGIPCALNDLSHFGLIEVAGEDAMTLLQGQVTNDMREVNANHSNLCGWCNVKGRMLANFRVFKRGDAYYLQTPKAHVESVIKRLRMYVLRSKVELKDVSDELARFGVTGDCALKPLQNFFTEIPEAPNSAVQQGNSTLIRIPGALPRFEVIGPAADLSKIWESLESEAKPMAESYWALQEIRAGIPTIYPETIEAFVPQMTNMQLIDGVSFTKGCYTGQEVVARMQYLGKLKRRMFLAHVNSDTPPKPGDELFSSGSTSGQGTGKVVDAQAADGGYDLLAVIEIASAEGDKVHLGVDGPKLEFLELPYALTENKDR